MNLAAEHRLAEIFKHDEAAVEIESVDRGRGEARLFEGACDRHERRNVLGEMNMRAVRFAAANGRSVGLARRIHQYGEATRKREPGVGPRRGVALQVARVRPGKRRAVEEVR